MKVTDEMVEAACLTMYEHCDVAGHMNEMRAALEAALGQFMLQYGDNVELKEAEQIGFERSIACIEELAAALKPFTHKFVSYEALNEREDDEPYLYLRSICVGDLRCARDTLERWGLK